MSEAHLNPNASLSSKAFQIAKASWQPEVIVASDLEENPPPPVDWLVDGLMPVGLAVIAGRPKAGKSIWAMGLTLAACGGSQFLGREVNCGSVLYLDLENGRSRIYERLQKSLNGKRFPRNLHIVLEWQRGNRAQFLRLLDERKDLKLAVIDIWNKFRSPLSRQDDRYEQDTQELAWLSQHAQERRITIGIVGHLIKGEDPNDPYSAIGGSVAVTGNADAIYMLRRLPNGDRSLMFQGRDLDHTEWVLVPRHPIGFEFKCEASADTSKAANEYLIAIANAHEPLIQAEIARRVGVSRSTAKEALDRLSERQLVANPLGPYVLTQPGWSLVEAIQGGRQRPNNPYSLPLHHDLTTRTQTQTLLTPSC